MKVCNMIGYINKIETMGLVDGPGIRTVIFMQGCPLRCLFCHNPETWKLNQGNKYTPLELVNKIKRYKPYYGKTGGVTFSGGEPLIQSKFLIEVCKLLKEENINICLDTSGVGTNINEVLDLVDLVIFDIKAIDDDNYKKMTGLNIDRSLEFLKLCQKKNKKIWIRQVIVPGINDSEEYILKLAKFINNIKNVEKIELLPYHTMGVSKYKDLNIDYPLDNIEPMDRVRCSELEKLLIKNICNKIILS